ncbi:virion structural protein [Synechococcus phage S-CAM1]|jgi:hypothetical protein|uniref:Virion structural protein n=1 Tax=Synechococcus phage S-CAM1 TaxID=754037 RepID=A0A1D8KFV0_9CAUD|nr:virion structural protein [Synechococcus phage S-CAM1]AOV57530.1 virion structural protein [Synechococcus phage S-CAM1]AOV57780.1 virion structural protein [Synechococcus phage S-CAM1]AOV58030.1 virion structural protein [Synechococcus phage S-CAM1]AOV58280.1 virion structural protein [Synechococcus phage S-CAM1]
MPSINISWQRSAGDSNYIYGMPGGTIGPNSGSRSVNVGFGQTYNLSSSGSGPGNTALRRLNSQTLGLDDRQGAGADNDYNDMIVYVSGGGTFTGNSTFSGPPATYGCMDSNAVNYNSSANVNSGCIYANPNPQLTVNGSTATQTIVEGDAITVSWSANDSQYMYTGSISGQGAPGSLSSSQYGGGSFVANPTSNTTYTYSVSYAPPTRNDSFSIPVNVKEIPEIIASFPNGSTILRGNSTNLVWSTSGDATTMSISPGLGLQNLSGTLSLSPTETTTYTLYASSPGYGGRLQDSVSLLLTVIQPPSASLTIPSTIDWGDSSFQAILEFDEVTSYDLTVEYTDLDGVMITHPAFTGADPSQTTVNLLIGDETSGTIPRWNNRGYSQGKVKMKAYGLGGQFVEKESIFNINIDQMPDAIDIPSSEDKFLGEEPVITPDVTVTSEQIVIDDVDIPVEVKASSPIQVEIDDGGVWYNVRQT